ncbi:unnamed protein product [Closterium sp. Naga37s-1]|nr:unnamed protein product [Closterium sp. Naga37s-1]
MHASTSQYLCPLFLCCIIIPHHTPLSPLYSHIPCALRIHRQQQPAGWHASSPQDTSVPPALPLPLPRPLTATSHVLYATSRVLYGFTGSRAFSRIGNRLVGGDERGGRSNRLGGMPHPLKTPTSRVLYGFTGSNSWLEGTPNPLKAKTFGNVQSVFKVGWG